MVSLDALLEIGMSLCLLLTPHSQSHLNLLEFNVMVMGETASVTVPSITAPSPRLLARLYFH